MDFFKLKIKYLIQDENGSIKKKTSEFVLNAVTFTDAEVSLQKALEETIEEYNLMSCSKMNIEDVIKDDTEDFFFKVKLNYISCDPDSGKEKKITEQYLVQSSSTEGAQKVIKERMTGSVVDWKIASISETKIIDCFYEVKM